MSHAIYTLRLVRENARFYKVGRQKNESNALDRDGVTNKTQVRKT